MLATIRGPSDRDRRTRPSTSSLGRGPPGRPA